MISLRMLPCAAAVLLGAAAFASPVKVTSVVPGGAQEPVEVELVAVRVDGSGVPVSRTIVVPGVHPLDLADGNWELSIRSRAFWSAPAVVSVSPDASAVLTLWPAGVVRASIAADRKGADVGELRMRFAPAAEGAASAPAGEVVCSREAERWQCVLPALPPRTATFDLVVHAPGFALACGRVAVQEGKGLTITVDPAGGALDVEIPRGADAVIRHDGAELPARWLSALAGGSIQPHDAEWEVASLGDVEPGEYSLCAAGRCRAGFVTPQGRLRLTLR